MAGSALSAAATLIDAASDASTTVMQAGVDGAADIAGARYGEEAKKAAQVFMIS